MGRISPVTLFVVAALVGAACAKIDYIKVPTPVQYGDAWSAEMQKDADAMAGPRYYLPRPFLHLKQPIPVASRVAFLSLTYNGTSKRYEIGKPEDAPTWVKRLLPKDVAISAALAKQLVAEGTGAQQSGAAGTAAEPKPPAQGRPSSTINGRVGFINDEDPVTELGSLMDVVYLPDFDEQFVIERSWGIGAGSLEVQLRNGWAVEVFGEVVDRSNFIPYLIDQVEDASTAALNVATQWGLSSVGVPVGALPLGEPAATQQSTAAGQEAAALDILGNVVLLKLVEIRVAQPGLYPILKPREIRDWFGKEIATGIAGVDEDKRFEAFLASGKLSWIRPNQVFVPAVPFTMIGFNTTTDAYIGAVRKDELGLGTYTSAGEPGDGQERDNEKLKTKVLSKIKSSLAGLAGAAQTAAAKLNTDQPEIEEKASGQSTEITFQIKVGQTLSGDEIEESTYQDWMGTVFGLNQEEKAAIEMTHKPPTLTLTDLPRLSKLAQ